MPTENKDFYRVILDDLTEFVARYRADGTCLYANEVFCSYFAKKPEEVIDQPWHVVAYPEDVRRVNQELRQLTPDQPVVVVENRIIDGRNRIRWCQFINRGLFDAQGRLVEFQAVGRDITERRQAQEDLRDSEARFRAIFDATFQFIGLLSPEGTLLEINSAALEFCGLPRERLVGRPLWENPGRRHSVASQQKLRNAIERAAQGQFIRFNDEVQDPHGKMIALDISIKPQRDAQGRVAYLIFESRDITDARLQEQERLNAAKLEALGVLAGGIAHDLNNIMMCVSLNLELLRLQVKRGKVDDERIQDALRNVMRASDLSKRLLTFAKGGDPVLTRLDLPELVRAALTLSLSGSNLKADFVCEPDLPPVLGDSSQLSQVIDHLVINAREATPAGGLLHIRLSPLHLLPGQGPGLPPGPYIRLEVADEGCGISRENLDRIFDPYFTTKAGGTGIGLTTCFSTVRRHGGAITVDSKVGKGTTFTILLHTAPESTLVAPAASAPSEAARSEGGGRILVIEDDPSLRHALADMLNLSGFDVSLADKGEAGFAQYRRALRAGRKFDVVLIDATITGGKGGAEALELLQRADPRVCAVIMSGYSHTGVMAEWQELGFRSALQKPFTCEKVVDVLNTLLAER